MNTGAQSPPLVYALVLNWNNWRDTARCVESLQHLDYQNIRLMLIDNGSTDNSPLRLRRLLPGVEILENGVNLGFGGGNNIGIRLAAERSADYVWLVNNDTVADARALSVMVKVAERNPNVGAVGSVLYSMIEPNKIQTWGGGKVNLWTGIIRHIGITHVDYITGASMLIRATALKEVGLFDEDFFLYWEDTDLCFRLRRAGWKLAVASDSMLRHAESASLGKANPLLDAYANESAVLFFRRYAPVPFVPILILIGGRIVKRLLRGKWHNAWSIGRAALKARRSTKRPGKIVRNKNPRLAVTVTADPPRSAKE